MNRSKLIDHMLKTLSVAQGCRHQRQDLATCPAWWNKKDTETIPAWCEYEREVMLCEINKFRNKYDLPLIGWAEVSRVESMAMGHSDYSRKFALYCAELVSLPVSQIQP